VEWNAKKPKMALPESLSVNSHRLCPRRQRRLSPNSFPTKVGCGVSGTTLNANWQQPMVKRARTTGLNQWLLFDVVAEARPERSTKLPIQGSATMTILHALSLFHSTIFPRSTTPTKRTHCKPCCCGLPLRRSNPKTGTVMPVRGRPSCNSFPNSAKRTTSLTKQDILNWLGDTPALLLVDELNNIDELTVDKSKKASDFANFSRIISFLRPAAILFFRRIFFLRWSRLVYSWTPRIQASVLSFCRSYHLSATCQPQRV